MHNPRNTCRPSSSTVDKVPYPSANIFAFCSAHLWSSLRRPARHFSAKWYMWENSTSITPWYCGVWIQKRKHTHQGACPHGTRVCPPGSANGCYCTSIHCRSVSYAVGFCRKHPKQTLVRYDVSAPPNLFDSKTLTLGLGPCLSRLIFLGPVLFLSPCYSKNLSPSLILG